MCYHKQHQGKETNGIVQYKSLESVYFQTDVWDECAKKKSKFQIPYIDKTIRATTENSGRSCNVSNINRTFTGAATIWLTKTKAFSWGDVTETLKLRMIMKNTVRGRNAARMYFSQL